MREVLLPLVAGGILTVRAPLDEDAVAELSRERGRMAGVAELGAARRAVAARFLLDPETPPLDDDAIRLGAAIHNLCWLLQQPHPAEGRGGLAKVARATERACDLPAPVDELALCARHALTMRLRTLTRRDVRVRFWAGRREFRGEQPPARLLRWQTLRRVREEQTTVDLYEDAVGWGPTRAVVAALFAASPLTDLLHIDRGDPPIELRAVARWLRVPRIARVIADEYLRRGLAAIEPVFTAALLGVYNTKGATDAATTATAFHSHLHLLDVLSRPPTDREGHLRVLRGYAHGRERAIADGIGLMAAADRIGLGRPADVARDEALRRNVDAYVEACAELVGPRRLQELTGLAARGAGAQARVA